MLANLVIWFRVLSVKQRLCSYSLSGEIIQIC